MKPVKAKTRGRGQVVVEMLLILPVFLTIIFTIMEMGHLAFWVITLNHATYECARIGAMLATRQDGTGPRDVTADMQKFMDKMVATARIQSYAEKSLEDPQAGVVNHDLVVSASYDLRLVFPISNIILASPKGSGRKTIKTVVRMPIEQPLQQGESVKGMGAKKPKPKLH